jgi:hypothetical protein
MFLATTSAAAFVSALRAFFVARSAFLRSHVLGISIVTITLMNSRSCFIEEFVGIGFEIEIVRRKCMLTGLVKNFLLCFSACQEIAVKTEIPAVKLLVFVHDKPPLKYIELLNKI